MNTAIAGQVKQASVQGYQMLLRSAISYETLARATGSEQAFENATKYVVGNMMDSLYKKLEIELLYGQSGLGVVDASPAPTATLFKITDAEFAPGIWGGSKKMKIDIYNGVTLVGTGTVKKADLTAKTIELDAPGVPGISSGHSIYPHGAYGKQMPGLHKIMTNSGVLFGIDAAQYELWEGNEFALPTADVLSFAVIQQAITKAVEKGLDKDVVVLCNPGHWDDLLTEQAGLRMYDSSYKVEKAENGAEEITFFSQNGKVSIVSSIYVKEGHAFVMCPEHFARIGSTDITFKRPGSEEKFVKELENYAGVELRAYTDQSLFCMKPGQQVIITNLKVN